MGDICLQLDHIPNGDFQFKPDVEISGVFLHACANGKGSPAFCYVLPSYVQSQLCTYPAKDTIHVVRHRQYFQEIQ